MIRLAFRCVLFLLLVVALNADDKKKQQQAYYVKPAQTADLDAPKLVTTKQECENWAMAAGLEAMLKQQNVSIDQSYWVMSVYGGELCVPEMPSIEAFAQVVNREFVLDDGRHVRLELHFTPGAPSNTSLLMDVWEGMVGVSHVAGGPSSHAARSGSVRETTCKF